MDYKKNAVGLAGIAAGIIAICTAVWPAWIGEVSQSDNRTMVQSAADKEKSFWESFFSKTGSEKNVEPISDYYGNCRHRVGIYHFTRII